MARNGFFTRQRNRSKMYPTGVSSVFDPALLKSVLIQNPQHAVVTVRNPNTSSDRSPKLRFLRPTDHVMASIGPLNKRKGFRAPLPKCVDATRARLSNPGTKFWCYHVCETKHDLNPLVRVHIGSRPGRPCVS